MKSKALKKRLVLKRETIASLDETVMNEVYGGHDSSPTCPAYSKYVACILITCDCTPSEAPLCIPNTI